MILHSGHAFLHSVAVLWIGVNIWMAMPYLENTNLLMYLHVAGVIANPIIIGIVTWYGTIRKKISLRFIYPTIIILLWFVGPALFAVFRWGKDAFFNLLLVERSIVFWLYFFLSLLIYTLATFFAQKKSK